MHICVSLPDPSLAQALAVKEWCYKGSFVNEASRLMVEGPGTAFLFRMVRPQNCMKTNLFLEIRAHFAFAGPFFSRKSVPQTKKGPSLAALYRCITTSCHFKVRRWTSFGSAWMELGRSSNKTRPLRRRRGAMRIE